MFIKWYQLIIKPIENNSKPEELEDKLAETNHTDISSYQNVLMMPSSDRLHCRKVELVLQYHCPYKLKIQRVMLIICFICSSFTFCQFCDECELRLGHFLPFCSKLSKPGILEIVSNNKSLVESYSDFIELNE